MATTTSKLRSHHNNLPRSNSFSSPADRKPGSSSHHNADASDPKPQKPVPNYLKPTISSRSEPGKFPRKTNIPLDDPPKLLRRRSFDRPPSSLSSPPSTSSPRLQKSLNISPRRPCDRPSLPREKPLTAPRSASFHASRSSSSRVVASAKSPPVASRGSPGTKKSGLGNSSSNSKREASSANVSKKPPDRETSQASPPAPVHEEVEEVEKVATTEIQVANVEEAFKSEDKEEPAADADEPNEEEESDTHPVLDGPNVTEAANEDQKSSAKEDHKTEEQKENEADDAEEAPEDNQDNRATKVGDISTDVATDLTDAEEEKEGEKEKEEESRDNEEEEASKTATTAVSPEGTKRQAVQGKKESPSAYNDVIEKTASKLLENRKNKVKALVGAFETVIDYETAASK